MGDSWRPICIGQSRFYKLSQKKIWENSKFLSMTSKCFFSIFGNTPLTGWAAHIARNFLTCCSCSYYSSMFKYNKTYTHSLLLHVMTLTTRFFICNTFTSNTRLKLVKNRAKAKQHPEAKLLLFENYSLSSSMLSSKNNMRQKTGVSVLIRLYD